MGFEPLPNLLEIARLDDWANNELQSFTLLLERRLNSLIIPLPHTCSVLLLNKTSMSIAQKTHHTLAGIQLSHKNIEWGEGGLKYVLHRV